MPRIEPALYPRRPDTMARMGSAWSGIGQAGMQTVGVMGALEERKRLQDNRERRKETAQEFYDLLKKRFTPSGPTPEGLPGIDYELPNQSVMEPALGSFQKAPGMSSALSKPMSFEKAVEATKREMPGDMGYQMEQDIAWAKESVMPLLKIAAETGEAEDLNTYFKAQDSVFDMMAKKYQVDMSKIDTARKKENDLAVKLVEHGHRMKEIEAKGAEARKTATTPRPGGATKDPLLEQRKVLVQELGKYSNYGEGAKRKAAVIQKIEAIDRQMAAGGATASPEMVGPPAAPQQGAATPMSDEAIRARIQAYVDQGMSNSEAAMKVYEEDHP